MKKINVINVVGSKITGLTTLYETYEEYHKHFPDCVYFNESTFNDQNCVGVIPESSTSHEACNVLCSMDSFEQVIPTLECDNEVVVDIQDPTIEKTHKLMTVLDRFSVQYRVSIGINLEFVKITINCS